MNPQSSHTSLFALPLRVLLMLAVLLAIALILVPDLGINTSQAQDQAQESENVPSGQEKELEDKTPPHLPIKVKVRHLNRKKWAHELEVEVKNTSGKPIYFLLFYIVLPEVKREGADIGFQLRYGRIELIKMSTPVDPGVDVPIQPGETYSFKIPESSAKGWDDVKQKEHKSEPKRLRLVFQSLNFGDGTGYSDAGEYSSTGRNWG